MPAENDWLNRDTDWLEQVDINSEGSAGMVDVEPSEITPTLADTSDNSDPNDEQLPFSFSFIFTTNNVDNVAAMPGIADINTCDNSTEADNSEYIATHDEESSGIEYENLYENATSLDDSDYIDIDYIDTCHLA